MLTLPEQSLKEYIYKEQSCTGQKVYIGCMVAVPMSLKLDSGLELNLVNIGVSQCHSTDKWDKEKATLLAFQRASTATLHKDYKISNVEILTHVNNEHGWFYISDIVNDFVRSRCISYYKDKLIVFPKIEYF